MQILKYGAARLAIFFAVFALLIILDAGLFVAIIGATVVSLAVSYLFLNPMRLKAGNELANAWQGRRSAQGKSESEDADAEDAYTKGRFLDPEDHGALNSSEESDDGRQQNTKGE